MLENGVFYLNTEVRLVAQSYASQCPEFAVFKNGYRCIQLSLEATRDIPLSCVNHRYPQWDSLDPCSFLSGCRFKETCVWLRGGSGYGVNSQDRTATISAPSCPLISPNHTFPHPRSPLSPHLMWLPPGASHRALGSRLPASFPTLGQC